MTSLKDARILLYSHDTFGLGHLRRCRAIAHALVEAYSGLQVLIISGAPIAGAFDYRARVDFVKVPSVIKLRNGEYTSLAEHVDLSDTLKMRRSIILETARSFAPDVLIVDKEPMGLHGEIEETLAVLKGMGTRLVLGLREVMDSPELLAAEWSRKKLMPRVDQYFDDIWVYGPRGFHDPLMGLEVPAPVHDRMRYVGFLKRTSYGIEPRPVDEPYILVTPGGGGDGAEMIRDVIAAYRHAPDLPQRAVIVLGPYMPAEQRAELRKLACRHDKLEVMDFSPRMEDLMANAAAVICMSGYNTWCEVLSFDKPALILPRTEPREEQLIRARRATDLNAATMLMPEQSCDPAVMADAIRALGRQLPPSVGYPHPDLDGLENIIRIMGEWLAPKRVGAVAV
ncbi:glycosyltransferase family protein [Paracoccus laeviglucosivorans]|uniref:Predicted glycosyl transferase n=1 Tax=Paracoccus laeviglucosivorans TaxID=1197861 RepID=A0A521D2S8_9RHOB|nr:glycosyltransferase family protein [Paracoccus laeviglucosivorans]SMO66016.1 Predicted glycosyl transferase [Paracoccus laeviglucosivorans]